MKATTWRNVLALVVLVLVAWVARGSQDEGRLIWIHHWTTFSVSNLLKSEREVRRAYIQGLLDGMVGRLVDNSQQERIGACAQQGDLTLDNAENWFLGRSGRADPDSAAFIEVRDAVDHNCRALTAPKQR